MKRSYTSVLSASLVLAMAVALPAAAQREEGESPQDVKSQEGSVLYNSDDDPDNDCGEGNNVTIFGDPKMWPPNHKYQPYTITATDDDGGEVVLGTSGTHDEYVEGATTAAPTTQEEADTAEEPEEENGAGNTTEDSRPLVTFDSATGTNTADHELRSERSGRGNGRSYTLNFNATFDDGSCSGSATVEVPHDMRSDNAPEAKDRIGNG